MSLSASFWQRFNEPIIALILSSVLFALYVSIDSYTEFQDWQTGVDNHSDLSANETEQLTITLEYAFLAVVSLSVFTTTLAIFFAATNDRLALPIRLLAASENGNKLIYVLLYIISFPCNPEFSSLKCSTGLQNATAAPFSFVDDYGLYDIAQYCQFFISLSRFLATSFSGAYFRYTLRWPILQLIVPYLLRLAIELCFCLFPLSDQADGDSTIQGIKGYVTVFPYFVTCGLDFVTTRNMRKMLTSSVFIIINYICTSTLWIFIWLFSGNNIGAVLWQITYLTWALFFHLGLSIVSCICFRKRKESPSVVVSPQISTISIRKI